MINANDQRDTFTVISKLEIPSKQPIYSRLVETNIQEKLSASEQIVWLAYFLQLILDYQLFHIFDTIPSSTEAFTVSRKWR